MNQRKINTLASALVAESLAEAPDDYVRAMEAADRVVRGMTPEEYDAAVERAARRLEALASEE